MATRTVEYALTMGLKHSKGILPAAGTDDWGGTANPSFAAGDKFLFDELEIKDTPEFIEDDSNTGTQLARGQDIGIIKCDVSAKGKVFTNGFAHLISSVLGWEDLEGPKAVSSNYSHLICFSSLGKDYRAYTTAEITKGGVGFAAGDRLNTMVHLCREEGPGDVIAKNVQITDWAFSVSQKDALTLEFSGVGEKVVRDSAKTASKVYTLPTNGFLKFFTLRDVSSSSVGPVGSLSEVRITDFSIKGKFGVAADIQSTKTGTGREYPYSDGKSSIDVEFTVFLHDNETWKGYEQNQTAIAMKMAFTKGSEQLMFLIPNMRVVSAVVDTGNAGSVKVSARVFDLPATFTDPFTAERSLSGAEQALDGPAYGAFYMVVVDNQIKSGLRMV